MKTGMSLTPLIIFASVCIVGISIALIIHKIESRRESRRTTDYNKLKEKASDMLAVTFAAELCNSYALRIATKQPIDNDRILPGGGKEHTLKAMFDRTNDGSAVPSVIEQIGDVFS